MKVSSVELFDKAQTASEMYRIVEEFYNDLNNIMVVLDGKKNRFSDLNIFQAFDAIKLIPYRQDTEPIEVLARPLYIGSLGKGEDCKKKALLMASYLRLKNIPYRFVAVSTLPNKRIHHVFTQGNFKNIWLNLDPTYSDEQPFTVKNVTKYEVL